MMMIQQFAAFCGTTAQTLRFYDRKGLLPADYISPVNGYRYYRAETAVTFHKIETLKRAGFTLAEIGEKLAQGNEQWMIESLEDLIQRHQEKIALCEALKAEYIAKAAWIRETVTPLIKTHVKEDHLLVSQGENAVSVAYRSREAAELCTGIIKKGSRSDIFICLDYDDIKEVLADRCIVGAFTKELSRCSLNDLDLDEAESIPGDAYTFLCYIGFNPDIASEEGVQLLEGVKNRFGTKGECIFAADIDMQYSGTVIDVAAIK